MKIASAPSLPFAFPTAAGASAPSAPSPTSAPEDQIEFSNQSGAGQPARQTDQARRSDAAQANTAVNNSFAQANKMVDNSFAQANKMVDNSFAQAAALTASSLLGLTGPALKEPLRMLLIGPPGSGKGTQAEIVDRFFDVPHISTGQILRQEIKQQTELGKAAEPYVKAGQMVPDTIMLPMVDKRLEQEESFILDGFPRSTAQAEHLDATLTRLGKPLTSVANLQVSDETVVKRLKERGREDDTEEIIRARLKVYHEQSEPVIAHYLQQGLLDQIPAEGKVPEVGFNLIMQLNRRLDYPFTDGPQRCEYFAHTGVKSPVPRSLGLSGVSISLTPV